MVRVNNYRGEIHTIMQSCYAIPDVFSCDTVGAIYILDCEICGKQYVGETGTTVRSRMKHHKNATHSDLNRPVYSHLRAHRKDFNIFSITIIDQITNMKERKEKEKQYIDVLKTKLPFGLNVLSQ